MKQQSMNITSMTAFRLLYDNIHDFKVVFYLLRWTINNLPPLVRQYPRFQVHCYVRRVRDQTPWYTQ